MIYVFALAIPVKQLWGGKLLTLKRRLRLQGKVVVGGESFNGKQAIVGKSLRPGRGLGPGAKLGRSEMCCKDSDLVLQCALFPTLVLY